MYVQFPLFIMSKDDKSIDKIDTLEKLKNWYEQIDIEEELYVGWDINGYPLKLLWDLKSGVKVEVTHENPKFDDLWNTIKNYAQFYRPQVPFVYSGQKDNVIELYKAAKEHIVAGRLIQRVRHFFQRKKK